MSMAQSPKAAGALCTMMATNTTMVSVWSPDCADAPMAMPSAEAWMSRPRIVVKACPKVDWLARADDEEPLRLDMGRPLALLVNEPWRCSRGAAADEDDASLMGVSRWSVVLLRGELCHSPLPPIADETRLRSAWW